MQVYNNAEVVKNEAYVERAAQSHEAPQEING